MKDKIRIKEKNLVLDVSDNVNIEVWDESKYYNFVDNLVGNRTYQKEAILTALKFMCSGEYKNTSQLAYENFTKNELIKDAYVTYENFERKLSFPNSYSASIDLATGTGKSWVMYAIATIMLAEGKVDQVLVLVPSVTIEEELTKKFRKFAIDENLNGALKSVPPKITNGSESIVKGCICIENRDAVYKNSSSSILDSLNGKGQKTLLLCDEVHHVYYSEENEWKSFVEKINFKYNIGLSGTCYYKDNTYFSNVIYRYSLKQAIEDRRVKLVEYVSESNIPVKDEDKWKVIINSHEEIKKKINYLPLTLIVTANVNSCKKKASEFKRFLKESLKLNDEEVNEKVLIIHSKSDAALDRIKLKSVDNLDSKVEWIFSVSMLTEGWDVKRVFQIVPDEERAFNSKLLIAQVLGRGLRIPVNWDYQEMGLPKVTIFNHAKWASSVKKLVDEVLEIEKKLSNSIIEDSEYNFELLNVDYKPDKIVTKIKKEGMYNLFDKGYIVLPTDSQNETINADFVEANTDKIRSWITTIYHKTYTIDDVATAMWYKFDELSDGEDKNEELCKKYKEKWTVDKLKKVISLSLEKSGNNEITEKLKQKFLSSIGVIFRQGSSFVDYKIIPDNFTQISTKSMHKDYVSASALNKEKVLFWTSRTEKYLSEEEIEFFNEVIDTTNAYRQKEVRNIYDFKTPQTFVIADSDPEKEFIKKLTELRNNNIKSWVKSNSKGFYSFEYSWRKGEHAQRGIFNPDFFIIFMNRVLVVEIKSDEQIANPEPENIGKHKAAIEHFKAINEKLHKDNKDIRYKFTMLTPRNYEVFFNKLNSGDVSDIDSFNSELDATILENN